jgi:hypothetical protein
MNTVVARIFAAPWPLTDAALTATGDEAVHLVARASSPRFPVRPPPPPLAPLRVGFGQGAPDAPCRRQNEIGGAGWVCFLAPALLIALWSGGRGLWGAEWRCS